MSYIEESLSRGEVVHRVFPLHWVVWFNVAMHFVLALVTIGLWLIPALWIWLGWKKTEQGVTNKRVIHKHGVIGRVTNEMRLAAIEAIHIQQGVMGRLLGFGSVTVTGRGEGDVTLKWVADPLQVKKEIENAEYDSRQSADPG
jgi:membrane protein YdbS with pleckstrin-like domain